MEQLLSFFADLILFTFGLGVVMFWLILIVAIVIELWDTFHEKEEDLDV